MNIFDPCSTRQYDDAAPVFALAADFGNSDLRGYDPIAGWTSLDPVEMMVVDHDNDGKVELFAFFTGFGLWMWDDAGQWSKINNLDA